jgi:serine/threonine-protein kinase
MRGSMAGEGEFRRLGPYLLLRTSGAGGMGRVDLCLRASPDGAAKLYVLKRMHAELRSREQDARFRREANIALQLSHEAIARTVGVEEIDGEQLLLQELVHGVDVRLLETRLATSGERVPLAIAVHVASEVALALAYAHAFGDLGIVHRDVTPDNIMLAFSGEVKLVDFGIARSNVDATLTSTGHIVGRPTYTAPEVWEGAQADRRADIYSLGVVLWQLLTGRRLEDARAAGAADAAPAPSTINPEVPAPLDAVVARALAHDRQQRFQHAGDLEQALRAFLPGDFVPEPAVAALLARHFDVARERRMLADEVERATRFLHSEDRPAGDETPGAAPPLEVPAPSEPSPPAIHASVPSVPLVSLGPRRTRIVAAAAAAGMVLVVVLLAIIGRPSSPPPPPPTVAATAPRAPIAPPPPRPASPPPRPASTPLVPAPAPDVAGPNEGGVPTAVAPAPPAARVRPISASAGRARPPGAKAARPTPDVSADELLRRAQEKFDVGETGTALALAHQAAAVGGAAPAHILMGKVLMSERRFDEAERAFAEAVRLDPGDARAARLLALVRETRRGGP